jgi:Carbohydrate/starch-binding module (family 21)
MPDGTASILGRVRVRNIAFSKCVAIRFSFYSWQTTGEVTGHYVESINSEYDKFSFTIPCMIFW